MAWYRVTPGVPPEGVPGVYCDNSKSPREGWGIGGHRAPGRGKKRARWKAQSERNRAARASLYSEAATRGSSFSATEWHQGIDGIRLGTVD